MHLGSPAHFSGMRERERQRARARSVWGNTVLNEGSWTRSRVILCTTLSSIHPRFPLHTPSSICLVLERVTVVFGEIKTGCTDLASAVSMQMGLFCTTLLSADDKRDLQKRLLCRCKYTNKRDLQKRFLADINTQSADINTQKTIRSPTLALENSKTKILFPGRLL